MNEELRNEFQNLLFAVLETEGVARSEKCADFTDRVIEAVEGDELTEREQFWVTAIGDVLCIHGLKLMGMNDISIEDLRSNIK